MSGCQNQTTSQAAAALDPYKRVKYSLGMVLGADDFDQEFAYLSNRDQWLTRDTIGYGTACGLKVSIETDARGPRISIAPGIAISPRGQLIRVTPAQCVYLNDWLTTHWDDLARELGSPPADRITLYVVLRYRACPTDPVPIPGEPCRDETESTVDSRWKDNFKLELSFKKAPDQTQENAVRDFVEWMSHIEISDAATSLSLEDFLTVIRNGAQLSSPPSPPADFMYGSPPAGIVINRADTCEFLRAAMRVWVTELRPLWRGPACEGAVPEEEQILLAELDVPLDNGQAGGMSSEDIHEEHRPFVIHLRMLQEWLLCGPKPVGGDKTLTPASAVVEETTFGQVASVGILNDQYALADHTHGTPPVLEPGDTVVSETTFEQMANAGTALQYSRADHTHGTPSGHFVEYPSGLPRYSIVAGGIVRGDGTSQSSTYNGLTAQESNGFLYVKFDDYTNPDGTFMYIIKAMPVFHEKYPSPLVTFFDFKDAIILQVTQEGKPIGEALREMEFVIEVSQYDFGTITPLPAVASSFVRRPRINLNTASVDQLRALPRIGPELANRIVALRKKMRGFKSLNDLTKVEGIGEEILRVIEPFVTL